MSMNIRIECLPEPKLLFGADEKGVEPRRLMARYGAADKSVPKQLRIAIVGPAAETQIAQSWLPRLNRMAVAREKNARRYPNWPGAPQALGVTFVVEERFVRPLDDDRLNLARINPHEQRDLMSYSNCTIQRSRDCLEMLGPTASLCACPMKSPI